MDLKERKDDNDRRHPWETARLGAIQTILRPHLFEGIRILDVGCGDGFVARGIGSQLQRREITAIDSGFTAADINRLETLADGIDYRQQLPDTGRYDLLLLLDLLEHIDHDQEFLAGLVATYLVPGGKVLITVPAFPFLFSRHDVFLCHVRRYRLKGVAQLATAAALRVTASGYLFFSLLLPRLLLHKLIAANRDPEGVGNWRHGRFVTNMIEAILTTDNRLLLAAARLGITLPGLTGWVLCEKPL